LEFHQDHWQQKLKSVGYCTVWTAWWPIQSFWHNTNM